MKYAKQINDFLQSLSVPAWVSSSHVVEKSITNLSTTVAYNDYLFFTVLGSWKEPMPGYTDSKNGPQGFIMGAAKGVVRRLPVNEYLIYDYIPVDIVVNYMLVALWQTSINWSVGILRFSR